MTAFKSYSQAAQDRFVMAVYPEGRTFLDIGCCHPTELSNTYVLEQLGWRGLLVDNDSGAAAKCSMVRESDVCCVDATLSIFPVVMLKDKHPDYLSLDVDSATVATLKNILPFVSFRVATIEHDMYRFGPGPKAEIEKLMRDAGYDLVCEDVCSADGQPFENWYVAPEHSERAERFRCQGKRWTEIFPP